MKKLLLMATAILLCLSASAQISQYTWDWDHTPSSVNPDGTYTAYMFTCPVSKDVNGALSINVGKQLNLQIKLPATEQYPNGGWANISAVLMGAPPDSWEQYFARPEFGKWVYNPDGSQWFCYRIPMAIPTTVSREFIRTRGGEYMDPQRADKWQEQFQVRL